MEDVGNVHFFKPQICSISKLYKMTAERPIVSRFGLVLLVFVETLFSCV